MKKSKIIFWIFVFLGCFIPSSIWGNPAFYHRGLILMPACTGAYKYGLYGYTNPAILTYVDSLEFTSITGDDLEKTSLQPKNGVFVGWNHIGYSQVQMNSDQTYHQLGTAIGNRSFSFGINYGWNPNDPYWMYGILIRPTFSGISLGYTQINSEKTQESILDLAYRPFQNETLTLFADYGQSKEQSFGGGDWSIGGITEPWPGVYGSCRYLKNNHFSIALGMHFDLNALMRQTENAGSIGFGLQTAYNPDTDTHYRSSSFTFKLQGYDRSLLWSGAQGTSYLKMDLSKATISYYQDSYFIPVIPITCILDVIQSAKEDATVSGIVIILQDVTFQNQSLLWEFRQALQDFKSLDKKVVIYLEFADLTLYDFVSVADKIILDPQGSIQLNGLGIGRNYFKNTLEKFKIGFEEFRLFKYKTAMEMFSKDRLSEEDREQKAQYLDTIYQLYKTDICQARNISTADYEILINDKAYLGVNANKALELNLIDEIGRWEPTPNIMVGSGNIKTLLSADQLAAYQFPKDHQWGEPPVIAIVYAIGLCDTEIGISARKLNMELKTLIDDPQVSAIIVRVDSPGGDGFASDLIAQTIRDGKTVKPIIISQGYMAASAGYWISMYGDKIIAYPGTLTGSIGVIGGLFYDKGLFQDTLGITSDSVGIGKHADLAQGFLLPYRNFTEEERKTMLSIILEDYRDFVKKVAQSRNQSEEKIESIAQGRIWSGKDALDLGLVDELGGLNTAIQRAKKMAGIPKDADIHLVEYPKPNLLNLEFLLAFLGVNTTHLKSIQTVDEKISFFLKHNQKAMAIYLDGVEL